MRERRYRDQMGCWARVTAESLVSEVETATTLPSIVVTYVDLMKHHVIGLRILDLIIAEIPRCGPVALCNVGDTVVDFLYVTLSILKILKRSLGLTLESGSLSR